VARRVLQWAGGALAQWGFGSINGGAPQECVRDRKAWSYEPDQRVQYLASKRR